MQSFTHQITKEKPSWAPQYHFYKPEHWLNDPNGLFYLDGTYHLFFQLNPDDVVWGNMHWGHATSDDLLNWQHKPIALFAEPKGLGYIFSGGAIVDKNNTSGLAKDGEVPVIANFTQQSIEKVQVQSMAFSLDGGEHFSMYSQNPVIANPGLADFRDPKVVWFEPKQYWVKTVVAGQCVFFYQSNDLINWQKLSEFGHQHGAHGGVWECPDLFPLICSETGIERWVLLISINPGGPNGGSATQYFIGDFDGEFFTSQDNQTRWLDYGTDCYAGITWDNTPNIQHSRTLIAWMSNWQYANDTPDNTWRGAMTLPRSISLQKCTDKYRLLSPAAIIFEAESKQIVTQNLTSSPLLISKAYKVSFNVQINQKNTILVWKSAAEEVFTLTFDTDNMQILADRTQAGFAKKGFDSVIKMPIEVNKPSIMSVEVYADNCSLELFFNGGQQCMTILTFPTSAFSELFIDAESETQILKGAQYMNLHN
ncbi:GH32 C-terminal domain-containing protein [Shewanella sp.]|jgi:fructan beta-fructosidase|uniref:GH32 C-terminal domain-containing protein n=1 Tax=Shewanella sp. TaxID=50422 RepID=UPI003569C986